MKDTDYAYAVARVRGNETRLLTENELSAAVAAPDFESAALRLREKGYEIGREADIAPALGRKLADAWALIEEILPDPSAFDPLIIGGDFHNLKVLLKALVGQRDPAGLYMRPSVYDPEAIRSAVFARKNEDLPEPLRHAERSAYRILTKTRSAQLADAVVDRASLEWSIALAKQRAEAAVLSLAETRAALADLKILRRCVRAGKSRSFVYRSVCACAAFDRDGLADVSQEPAGVGALVAASPLAALVPSLQESDIAFEKACDEFETASLRGAKWQAFGIEPLLAYYSAVETEVRNVRILLCGKRTGLTEAEIRERMRRLYA